MPPQAFIAHWANNDITERAGAQQHFNELCDLLEVEKPRDPARPVTKPGFEADLKKRTLTNLYNQRPAWLDNAHRELDLAVATTYDWTDYTPEMPDEEILRRLLRLNLERSNWPGNVAWITQRTV